MKPDEVTSHESGRQAACASAQQPWPAHHMRCCLYESGITAMSAGGSHLFLQGCGC